ncbi:MAG: hypothetical protein OK454_05785 [Thaumarchaeota archaeon]|nr:hypothetical protein [Nitrososphaerota archaeon]
MGKNGVLGIIIPISEDDVMHDIFHGRSVYASLAKGDETDLAKGDRIFFYDSAETHTLEGEALITAVAFEPASQVLTIDEGALYIDRRRFADYVSSLPEGDGSILRVLYFKDPTMYATPLKCDQTVPEGGAYMTGEVFSRIAKQNR